MSTLYVVATPIGNLSDLTPRAAAVLGEVDFVAAEDTRVTAKLLNHLGLKKPLVSCYRHNEADRADMIIDRILAGESCAMCSDAGTPAVSDPGEELVRRAAERGVNVVPIPGPSAVITALSASGLASGRFCFEGFLPTSNRNRKVRLEQARQEYRTMIFYEAPHKLVRTLKDFYATLGDRTIVLARELTKIHEEIEHTTLAAAVEEYSMREPRGEYVLIIEGLSEFAPLPDELGPSDPDPIEEVARLRREEGLSLSDACRRAAQVCHMKKGEIYSMVIARQNESGGDDED